MKTHTVFYSWQSDLANRHNRSLIRNCITQACGDIEDGLGIHVLIDEATSRLPGSPAIPEAILEKISKSSIFIGDVSIINHESKDKKTPNPNVLFELGYAVALLGWERVILIYNTAYSPISDLPFDLDKRRMLVYNTGTPNSEKEQSSKVKAILREGIETILKSPERSVPMDSLPKKHKLADIDTLKELFALIHPDNFERFLEWLPQAINTEALSLVYSAISMVSSLSFHLYDTEIRSKLDNLFDELNFLTNQGDHYFPTGHRYMSKFGIPGKPMTPAESALYKSLELSTERTRKAYKELFKTILTNIPEFSIKDIERIQ